MTASPLRRTLYTALESFEPVFQAHPEFKLIALPDLQETSDVPCDTGSEPQALQQEFAGKNVDLDMVHDGWNSKVCENSHPVEPYACEYFCLPALTYPRLATTPLPTQLSESALVLLVAG